MPDLRALDRPGLMLAVLNLGLGVVLIAGGPLRTSSPSFAMALEVMSPDQWGLLFLAGGLVCLFAAGLGRWGAVAVGVGAGVHFFWALALIQSATANPAAGLTGCVVYTWVSATHIWTSWRLAKRVA